MARPRIIASPDEFDGLVDEYIAKCALEGGDPITWTGLALSLGLSSRQSIDNYLAYPEFVDSVKAKALVENAYEKRLHGNSPTGAIFALKNMNWRDKVEQEVSGPNGGPLEGRVVFEFVRPEPKG